MSITTRHQPRVLRLTDGTLVAGGDYCVCGLVWPCDAAILVKGAEKAWRALMVRYLLKRDLFKPKPHWLPANIWFWWREASDAALEEVRIEWGTL